MALARDLSCLKHHVLAVIGDGSLTAGEAFEGLNLAGHMGRRLRVVLNDNEMSISPNVGALSLFLSRTLSQRWVRQTRKEVLNFLRSIPRIGQKLAVYAMRGEWSFKSFFTPRNAVLVFPAATSARWTGTIIKSAPSGNGRRPEDGPVLLRAAQKTRGYGLQASPCTTVSACSRQKPGSLWLPQPSLVHHGVQQYADRTCRA